MFSLRPLVEGISYTPSFWWAWSPLEILAQAGLVQKLHRTGVPRKLADAWGTLTLALAYVLNQV
jgi:hypothetical protein